MTAEEKARDRFERDTRDHEMTVLHDDGVYRHLRFKQPESSFYWFDLVTWPGYLTICGDVETYTFCRTNDMFTWFGGDARISPEYWAQKLSGPPRDLSRSYSHDVLRARVLDWARDHCEWGDGEAIYPALLAGALEREILHDYTQFEQEGRERLQLLEEAVGYMDCWEWRLRDFDPVFLWCCWAIVRGIAQYQAARSEAVHA